MAYVHELTGPRRERGCLYRGTGLWCHTTRMSKTPPRNPDIRDVAEASGFSIATVSRVLSGRGSTAIATREIVQQAARELGYRPNEMGRALRTRQSGAVGFMISSIKNSFYATIANEIEQLLTGLGYVTLIGNTNEDPLLQDQFLEEVSSRRVSAILMLCAVSSEKIERLAKLQPCILINRRLPELASSSFIGIDDYLAARQLAEAMVRRGASRVGIVRGPSYSMTSSDRVAGLTSRLADLGVVVPPDAIVEARLSISAGYQAAARLMSDKPAFDTLFCGNDQIAYGVYRRCLELSLRVPEDVRIYGFDDNPLNQWLAPWLDTVRVPPDVFARETVAQLKALSDGQPHRDVIVPYELVLRS